MPLLAHFRMLARYNRLANAVLYAACGRLSEEERQQTRPAFFRSIHGTLNHIMVGDRIWMGRFEGRDMPSTALDAILYPDLASLQAARDVEDARIETYTVTLETGGLEGYIAYVNNAGAHCRDPMTVLLAHLFNHQTHHRGQIHDMLSQTAVAPPSLDMHRLLRPDAAA